MISVDVYKHFIDLYYKTRNYLFKYLYNCKMTDYSPQDSCNSHVETLFGDVI